MTKFYRAFLCGGLLSIFTACATVSPSPLLSDDTSLSGEIVLTVYGLSCPLCASNLDQHLQRLPGVEELYPDLDTGDIRITLTEGETLPVSAFAEAVRRGGFTLQSARQAEE